MGSILLIHLQKLYSISTVKSVYFFFFVQTSYRYLLSADKKQRKYRVAIKKRQTYLHVNLLADLLN